MADALPSPHREIYPRVSLYAMMLAAAGIPLYLHLPNYAYTSLGIDLAVFGLLLLAIRLFDLVQDPFLGWVVEQWPEKQPLFATIALLGLAIGFPLLFSTSLARDNLFFLAAILMLIFSAYSLGMILIYGRSTSIASSSASRSLLILAGFREAGMLIGAILASASPALIALFFIEEENYRIFGYVLSGLSLLIAVSTFPLWSKPTKIEQAFSFSVLRDTRSGYLLILAFLNSLPLALTSALFLFFVEARLELGELAPLFLLLFFAGAGLSVPLWTALARRISQKITLLVAMALSILSFMWAAFLQPGDQMAFLLVCLISGAALGAEMVMLPAMFAISLAKAGMNASFAFGLWSFVGKLAPAFAAAFALTFLERRGFSPGATNDANALASLNFAYAILPCFLKITALAMVLKLPTEE